MFVSVLEMLYVLCCGCDKLSCLSNEHSSAQTLLLALSFELHPVTTLSPVLQPLQRDHHTLTSKDTGYNAQCISVATSECAPSSFNAPYLRLNNHISVTVALLKPSAHVSSCFASPLMHKLWHRCAFVMLFGDHSIILCSYCERHSNNLQVIFNGRW